MAFPTKDGKRKFGSAFVAKRYDSVHGADEKAPKISKEVASEAHSEGETPEFEANEKATGTEPAEEQHPVVAQHGPAKEVHIQHDHKNHKHRVTSTHEDGHRHMSDHEDAQAAHEEGGKLANVSLKTSDEAGDQQGAASEGDNDAVGQDGFMMPDLA